MFSSFKSQKDFNLSIMRNLQFILLEQRKQRGDLATINRRLSSIITELNIRQQADEFYRHASSDPNSNGSEEPSQELPENQEVL